MLHPYYITFIHHSINTAPSWSSFQHGPRAQKGHNTDRLDLARSVYHDRNKHDRVPPQSTHHSGGHSLTHSLTHCSALLCSSLLLDDHHSIGDYVSYDYETRRYKYTLIEHNRIISLHIHTFCSHSLIVDG